MNLADYSINFYIIRKAFAINHTELSDNLSLSRPILSGIENNKINPTISTLEKISSFFGVSLDIMLISEKRFELLYNLLKNNFHNETRSEFDLLVSEKDWLILNKLTMNKTKSNIGKVSRIVNRVIASNFPELDKSKQSSMNILAVRGILFQDDGFKKGMEFGCWIGIHIS